jgi:hypothetical protein
MSFKFKTSQYMLGLGSVMLLTACGGATPAGTLSPTCAKSPSVSSKKPAGSGGSSLAKGSSSLNLALSSSDPTLPAVGTGFLDIESVNTSNVRVTKRCTVSIRPTEGSDTAVRVWTAGHCFFEPATEEFKNSKFTMQIFLDGGYFSAPVEFPGYLEFNKFSELFNLVNGFVRFPEGDIARALPSGNSQACQNATNTYKSTLGSSAKSIACFSRDEMRAISGEVKTTSATAPLLRKVLDNIRQRENAVLSKLDADTKRLLQAYEIAHSFEQRRIADVRSISYFINEQFCAPGAVRPPSDKLNAEPDSTEACTKRAMILALLPVYMSGSDLALAKSVYEDTTTPLAELRRKTLGCSNITESDRIAPGLDLTRLTPCDMQNLSVYAWNTFIDRGPRFSAAATSDSVFGLNTSSYYGFYTNAFPTGNLSRSKAKLIPLNTSTVLDFEYARRLSTGAKLPTNTFLVNFDPAKQIFNPSKGASGSILSAFGLFPMALLSTVNGEATSGGSAITPLPQVGDEEDSVPVRSRSGAGC